MLKEKKTVSVTIRINEETKDMLQLCAEHYGMSLSEYIRLILVNHCRFKKI